MARPSFDDSTAGDDDASGDTGAAPDPGLVGYIQEGADGTGMLQASQNDDDVLMADANHDNIEKR